MVSTDSKVRFSLGKPPWWRTVGVGGVDIFTG